MEGPATKECTKCKKDLPLASFWRDPHHKTGKSSWCSSCYKQRDEEKKKANKESGVILEGITCNVCKIYKPASECVKDSRRKGGLDGRCRECFRKRLTGQKSNLSPPPASKISKPRAAKSRSPQTTRLSMDALSLGASFTPGEQQHSLHSLSTSLTSLSAGTSTGSPTLSAGGSQQSSLGARLLLTSPLTDALYKSLGTSNAVAATFGVVQTSLAGPTPSSKDAGNRSAPASSTHVSVDASCDPPQTHDKQCSEDTKATITSTAEPTTNAFTSTAAKQPAAHPDWQLPSSAQQLSEVLISMLGGPIKPEPGLTPDAAVTQSPFLLSAAHLTSTSTSTSDPGALPASPPTSQPTTTTTTRAGVAGSGASAASHQTADDLHLELGPHKSGTDFHTLMSQILQWELKSMQASTNTRAPTAHAPAPAPVLPVPEPPSHLQSAPAAGALTGDALQEHHTSTTEALPSLDSIIRHYWEEEALQVQPPANEQHNPTPTMDSAAGAAPSIPPPPAVPLAPASGVLVESGSALDPAAHVYSHNASKGVATGVAVVTTGASIAASQVKRPAGLAARPARLHVPEPASEPPTAMLISPMGDAGPAGAGPITLSPSPRPVRSPHDGGARLPPQLFNWHDRLAAVPSDMDVRDLDALSYSFRSLVMDDILSMASPASVARAAHAAQPESPWMDTAAPTPTLTPLPVVPGDNDADLPELGSLCDELVLEQLMSAARVQQ